MSNTEKTKGFLAAKIVFPGLAMALVAAAILGIRGNRATDTSPSSGASGVSIQRLTGNVKSDAWELTLAAILIEKEPREFDGVAQIQGSTQIQGVALDPPRGRGTVTEVVPPNEMYDHWCVNVALVEIDGFNVQIYVRDIGDGRSAFDQVAFQGSFNTSCATSPVPEAGVEFVTVSQGDFKAAPND
ncbi:MAG: hypothetical protein A2939_02175 [Parcubacteria group bacterium RIFCSPLOWO2_01_FULL_48_18]|nr:MAG: hypothetical protein A2939_02175 [Parcubacteria group bacterium RIFCSPLOWO2_01_FULL_48_18]